MTLITQGKYIIAWQIKVYNVRSSHHGLPHIKFRSHSITAVFINTPITCCPFTRYPTSVLSMYWEFYRVIVFWLSTAFTKPIFFHFISFHFVLFFIFWFVYLFISPSLPLPRWRLYYYLLSPSIASEMNTTETGGKGPRHKIIKYKFQRASDG
jgi:hypothetical protein